MTGADARWEVVERLENVDKAPQLELMGGVDPLVEETTRWYLTWEPAGDIEETIAAGRDGFERLAAVLGELGSDERRKRREQTAERLVGQGVPEPLARAHALRPEQRYAPDMVWVAGATGRPIEEVAEVFFEVGAALRLDWMELELERVPATTRMQRWALQAVREDAAQVRRELAGGVLAESAEGVPAAEAVEAFLAERADAQRRLEGFLRSLSREGEPDLAGPHARGPPAALARCLARRWWVGRRVGQTRRPRTGVGHERQGGEERLGTGMQRWSTSAAGALRARVYASIAPGGEADHT